MEAACPPSAAGLLKKTLTAEARGRSLATPYGICGRQSGTGTGFSASTSVSPVSVIPSALIFILLLFLSEGQAGEALDN